MPLSLSGVIDAATYSGVDATGTADSTTGLQQALTDAGSNFASMSCYLRPGRYILSAPLVVPPGVKFCGAKGRHLDAVGGTVVAASPYFSGAGILSMISQSAGNYGTMSAEQEISDLVIDGTAILGQAGIAAINATGLVHGAYVHDVGMWNAPDYGLRTTADASGHPYSWRMSHVLVYTTGGHYGYSIPNMTDSSFYDCEVINSGGGGWYINGNGNSQWTACRAEWSTASGFEVHVGNPNIQMTFLGCSTDSNTYSGMLIEDSGGSGNLQLIGCRFNRDGRNGGSGGGGLSGLRIAANSSQIEVIGCSSSVAQDDNRTNAYRPQYGISVAGSAYVQVTGGLWWGVTSGWNDGGSNTIVRRRGVELATGTTRLSITHVSAAAGPNAGTGAPSPVTAGTNDEKGQVTFGTGTDPDGGSQCVITFASPYATAPQVVLTANNSATAALGLYVASVGASRFGIGTVNPPAASQPATTYSVTWHVMS